MQKIIYAKKNDFFDVCGLCYGAVNREERADRTMAVISENFNAKQQVILDFVLSQSVALGV